MRGLAWGLVWVCLACGRLGTDDGDRTDDFADDGRETAAGPGSNVAGSASVSSSGNPAIGGAPVLVASPSGGSLGVTTSSGATGGATPILSHSRACISARLVPADSTEDSSESSGGASQHGGESSGPGGAGGADGGVDLGLGAGDLTVLVVFDKSGSMAEHWDERNRWQVANEAFMKAIEGVLDNLTIGTIFFPEPGGCEVAPIPDGAQIDFMRGRDFYEFWQDTQETRTPAGSTPLERAFHVADAAIEQGCDLGLLTDRFRVLLVTDGEPSCSDDTAVITNYAAEWRRLGVETWVMGVPGSSGAAQLLDAIAAAGGTQKHQSLGTPSELDDGLYTAVR